MQTERPAEIVPAQPQPLATVEQSEAAALAAIEAVERVETPDQAEELLRRITAYQQAVRLAKVGHDHGRRWATVRLQAERKMGELLGPAEHGGDRKSDQVDGDHLIPQEEKDARKHARKVAAIPDHAFTAYLETAEEPTRAGLLRAARPETTHKKTKPSPLADYLPDLLPGAPEGGVVRTLVVEWCRYTDELNALLDAGEHLNARFEGDRESLIHALDQAVMTARRLRRAAEGSRGPSPSREGDVLLCAAYDKLTAGAWELDRLLIQEGRKFAEHPPDYTNDVQLVVDKLREEFAR